ncbi:somatostatin-1A [Betta splendens]|uniref:Somatostatin-1A n=1 Tax=Betta splendens TaxID=158456 RepID=A0A9W2XEP5_BETSP|nr:somatostatin-1A [Betta splendens]
MLPSQVRLLLPLFCWALLGQVSSAPHTDLWPQALGADEARNKDLANLLLDSFVSELVAARGDRTLPELEEKEEVMRRHLSFSQRERKAGCRNFFWKTFTAC